MKCIPTTENKSAHNSCSPLAGAELRQVSSIELTNLLDPCPKTVLNYSYCIIGLVTQLGHKPMVSLSYLQPTCTNINIYTRRGCSKDQSMDSSLTFITLLQSNILFCSK